MNLNLANIHCTLHMIVEHNRSVLFRPIIEKLKLGRLEKLYTKFSRVWDDEVSYNLFRFYFLHYRKGLKDLKRSEINYIYLD